MWMPFSNTQYQSGRLCHLGLFDESRNWVSGYLSCVAVHNNSCCVCVAKIWQLDRGKMYAATFSEVYKGELWLFIQTSFYACLLSFSFFPPYLWASFLLSLFSLSSNVFTDWAATCHPPWAKRNSQSICKDIGCKICDLLCMQSLNPRWRTNSGMNKCIYTDMAYRPFHQP